MSLNPQDLLLSSPESLPDLALDAFSAAAADVARSSSTSPSLSPPLMGTSLPSPSTDCPQTNSRRSSHGRFTGHPPVHLHQMQKPDHAAQHSQLNDHEQKMKRRPHTKSRTGCVTCKKRRVKCDETRPSCRNCQHLRLVCQYSPSNAMVGSSLQVNELRLMHHYTLVVAKTIADAGISSEQTWVRDVPEMAFKFPFLANAVMMISATHLAMTDQKTWSSAVVNYRSESLRLLRAEVQHVNSENLDALVAASVLMILDAMASAAPPESMAPSSLPASTWLHHVRGAATILLAVGVLPQTSKFYSFMGIGLIDLANTRAAGRCGVAPLECFDNELADMYPVLFESPYYPSLAYLDKVHEQQHMPDFILRIFAFPALMDNPIVHLLTACDHNAQRILGAYYRLVRNYCLKTKDRLWFLSGVARVLPIDMDHEHGGLGFVTNALPVSQTVDSILARFDASFTAASVEAEALLNLMENPELQDVEVKLEDASCLPDLELPMLDSLNCPPLRFGELGLSERCFTDL